MEAVEHALAPHGLTVAGGFHPEAGDGAPEGAATLLLIAPGTGFWAIFAESPEAADGAPDPMDRWSARVIGAVAADLGATALFPFGGPPYHPFIAWAKKGEGARNSPVGMLVSPRRGLWTAYRGALALAKRLSLPAGGATDPCLGCLAPCLSACPVDAFASGQYDVPACTAHLRSAEGAPCRAGCLVRQACPVAPPPPERQRVFHMRAFLAAQSWG